MIRIDRPPQEAEGLVLTAMEEAGIHPDEFLRDSLGRVHVVRKQAGILGSLQSPHDGPEGQVVVDVAPIPGMDASCVSIVGKPAPDRNAPPRREPQFVEAVRDNLRANAGEDFHALHNDPDSPTFELVGELPDDDAEEDSPDDPDRVQSRFDLRIVEYRDEDVLVEVTDEEATGQFLVRPPETGITNVAPANSPTRHQDEDWVSAAREHLQERAIEGEIELGGATERE